MSDDEIQFGTLHPDGSVTNQRVLRQSDVRACPHFILDPDHYRPDGSCKCDDPDDPNMAGWGYTWKDGAWR